METHELIKMQREKLGLSQEELAKMVGYKDRSSIAKIESGLVDLTESKLKAFSRVLNIDVFSISDWDTATAILERDINSPDFESSYYDLCEYAKQLTPEQRRKLLEMAKIMFPEDSAQ